MDGREEWSEGLWLVSVCNHSSHEFEGRVIWFCCSLSRGEYSIDLSGMLLQPQVLMALWNKRRGEVGTSNWGEMLSTIKTLLKVTVINL